jgi:hypothetical protein
VSYLEALDRELREAAVSGRLRRRILAEIADHLACDPEADLGPPHALAREFADELGSSRTRRSAFATFVALAVAGIAYGVAFAAFSAADVRLPLLHTRTPALAAIAAVVAVLAPQVAFVAGTLTALRAFRRGGDVSLPAAEVRVLRRRTALALVSGLATACAMALLVYEYAPGLPAWLRTLGYACAAVAALGVLAATAVVLAHGRARVSAPGDAGDLFADLGPLVPNLLRGRPWAFALILAGVLFVLVAVAGIVQSDPFDGALRGFAEAAALIAGFAVLGRFLGLRAQ